MLNLIRETIAAHGILMFGAMAVLWIVLITATVATLIVRFGRDR